MDINSVNTDFLSRKVMSEIQPGSFSKGNNVSGKINEKDNSDDAKLRDACADFEAILLNFMLQSMRKTLQGDSLFGDSLGKGFYESIYFQEMATHIAKGENNLGIGESLYRQFQK